MNELEKNIFNNIDYDIRIMLVSPVPPPAGGDSTWAYKFLEYCKKRSKRIYHVNTSIVGKRADNVSDSIIIFDEIRRCFRIWFDILRGIRTFHPQIIHFNTNCSPRGIIRDYISALIIRFFQIPYIVHCRCNVDDQIGRSRIGVIVFKLFASKASKVFVQNTYSMEYVNDKVGIKSIFMPNFIESDYIVNEKKVSNEIEKILFVGHVRKTKGIDELLQVATDYPMYSFLVAGPVTEDYNLETINKRYHNVSFLGSKTPEEIRVLYDNSDLLLFPTYTEGFSNSLLEAMARGLPVITTDVGANKLMIEDKGGIIVPVGNYRAIDSAINSLSNVEIRKKMSSWNIKKVRDNYQLDVVIDMIWEEYHDICYKKNNKTIL